MYIVNTSNLITLFAAVNKTPVKCKVGYFSKGSAKKCTQCDRDKKEYQNEEGATYCKICSRGKVLLGAAVCEGKKYSIKNLFTHCVKLNHSEIFLRCSKVLKSLSIFEFSKFQG